jgi:hypothetical protein
METVLLSKLASVHIPALSGKLVSINRVSMEQDPALAVVTEGRVHVFAPEVCL